MKQNIFKMSLGRRIRLLVVFSVLLTGLIGSTSAYLFHVNSLTDEIFQNSEDAAEDAARLVYVEDAVILSDMIHTKEFKEVRQQAVELDDFSILEKWMKEKEYDVAYHDTAVFLNDLRYVLGVSDLTLVSCDENGSYVLAAADNLYSEIGKDLPAESRLGPDDYKTVTQTKPHPVRRGKMFLCSSYHRVEEGSGNHNLFVGVDIDLARYIKRERNFLINLVITYLLIIGALALFGIYFAKKHLTIPLNQLTNAALEFAEKHKHSHITDPKDPGIHTADELEKLNDSIFYLEQSVLAEQKQLELINRTKGKIDAELSIAREIQKGVLPDHFPQDTDRDVTDVYAFNDPAREVGGDFYDFFLIDPTHLALVIGDVSDKGIPAALFMMVSKLLIKEHAMKGLSPEEVLRQVNERLYSLNRAEMFVTVWIGILDTETGILKTANGGHEYPIFRLGTEPFEYFHDKHGMAIAGMKHSTYQLHEIQMKPGDALFVYSDGAVDARDKEGEGFGVSRLLESVNRASTITAKELVLSVKKDVEQYSLDAEQFDDITMLAMIYHKDTQPKKDDQTESKDSDLK